MEEMKVDVKDTNDAIQDLKMSSTTIGARVEDSFLVVQKINIDVKDTNADIQTLKTESAAQRQQEEALRAGKDGLS